MAVIGSVGSGKTALLLSMMNEMVTKEGTVQKNGKIAFMPQETFLLSATVRENVIFGEEFEEKKYQDIISKCQLISDIKILPGGDKTQIGERGINVSGGQKQRVSIARAVYSEADIYLIDDALSALDLNVGTKVMKHVFKQTLRTKTRVMVTHKVSLLKDVDRVVLLNQGKIVAHGKYEDIIKTPEYV